MANPKSKAVKVATPLFRLSYPSLHEPKGFEGQEPKYGATMLFPAASDMAWAKDAIRKVMTERFGADKAMWPKGVRTPLRNGDEKENQPAGYAGTIYIAARSQDRPGVVDHNCNEIVNVREDVYAGCYCKATIAFFYYDRAGNKGVGVALNNVQKVKDGEKFGGRSDAKRDFSPVDDEGGAVGAASGHEDDDLFG